MHTKLADPLVAGERLLHVSQLKQHLAAVKVSAHGAVTVTMWAEVPPFASWDAFSLEL